MAECDISNSDLATAFTSSSLDGENVNSDVKKRKTHRLKQRFQVVKKLGQGTYGKVQLAVNNETGQEVAIKTIKKSKVSSQQDLVRIRREIQIMSSINHPNIIHIFEVFENKDKIVLVMQYASGGELYDYVSFHKALSDSEARRVFRQIATAIYYCHKNKICHRDLKLENILLDEKGNAKIADFGLSNVFDDKHFLQTFCGSPLYASPEIVRGLPYFGPEVDCWSLGVLLYTLVYGAMPFDGSNFKKLVKQISEASYFEPPEKSAASDLIHKLLTPDPKERASIIDICTDPWVNQDSEHLLLQVAEDLSNLTKHAVRLDMLLALAPGSPTGQGRKSPKSQENNEFETEDVSNKRSNENTSANDSLAELAGKKSPKKKTKKSESNEQTTLVKSNEPNEGKDLEAGTKKNDEQKPNEVINKQDNEAKIETNQPKSPVDYKNQKIKNDQNDSQTSLKSNESSGSISRRRGKITIPKIWDENQEQTPANNKEKKEPISPGIFSVSELKKELEQKSASNQIPLIKRRDTLADTSELKLSKITENVKKYKNRSMSLNLNAIKNDDKTIHNEIKVKNEGMNDKKEPNSKAKEKGNADDTNVHLDDERTDIPKTSSTSSIKDDKSLAKQIIQKNIAKAKLMEKRQTSIQSNTSELQSGETTPLISIENSTISVMQDSPGSSTSNIFFKKTTNNNENRDVVSEVTNSSINPTPITRSYKKVIFTKDGAKITETGKFYSHEGNDGVTTRVEKKSRITHIINSNINTGTTTMNIQRSDSQSSTGSLDIFDDIFDDHWTGDNLFSNVKNLFHDFFGRRNEKLSLRSRAESLERNKWLPGKSSESVKSERKLPMKENVDNRSSSSFGSQRSLFQKSVFSNSSFSKSNFGKELNFDDMMSTARSRIDDYKKYRLTRDRFSSGDNEKDLFNKNSHIFDENDSDVQLDSNRKSRIEQWLDCNDNKDFDLCMSTYGTMRPRCYSRTMTLSNDFKSDIFKRVEVTDSSSTCQVIKHKTSTIKTENALPRNSEIQLNFSLDDSDGNLVINQSNVAVSDEKITSNLNDPSGTNLNDFKIEEPSSLLEQLRTFGYKKLVGRRLSDSSSTEDLPAAATTVSESTNSISKKSSAIKMEDCKADTVEQILLSHRMKQTLMNNDDDNEKGQKSNFLDKDFYDRTNRMLNTNLNNTTSSLLTSSTETVEERIHRKSYYFRFNDQFSSCRQRRRSVSRINHEYDTPISPLYSSSATNIDSRNNIYRLLNYQRFNSLDSERSTYLAQDFSATRLNQKSRFIGDSTIGRRVSLTNYRKGFFEERSDNSEKNHQ